MPRSRSGTDPTTISLFNPLPRTLAHYAIEMSETLERIGFRTTARAPSPATDDTTATLPARTFGHLKAAVESRRSGERTLLLWPTFGSLEPWIWLRCTPRPILVIHDPVPLRKQHGQGKLATELSKLAARSSGPRLLCHTSEAAEAVSEILGVPAPQVGLLPVLTEMRSAGVRSAERTILVAGQYKPSRDVALLEAIGPKLRKLGFRPRIVGSGWPSIGGWKLRDEFVSETDLADEIGSATAVLIPYVRYWQSAITTQALELGTPVVAESTGFQRSVFGEAHPGLVPPGSPPEGWIQTIRDLTETESNPAAIHSSYRAKVDRSWTEVLRCGPK